MLVTNCELCITFVFPKLSVVKVEPSKLQNMMMPSMAGQLSTHHSFLMLEGMIIILLRKATKENYQEYT